jgi:hypothetical protein
MVSHLFGWIIPHIFALAVSLIVKEFMYLHAGDIEHLSSALTIV